MEKNCLILDVNFHKNTNNLIISLFDVANNKYHNKTIYLDRSFKIETRNKIINFLKQYDLYTFKESNQLDMYLDATNFYDGAFDLSINEVFSLKQYYSSNDNRKLKIKNQLYNNYIDLGKNYRTDLKTIGLFFNIHNQYSVMGSIAEAEEYCKCNMRIIYMLYKHKETNIYQDINNKIAYNNCYGSIIFNNDIGIFSPRIIKEKGMHISNNYLYIKKNSNNIPNIIDLKNNIRGFIDNMTITKTSKQDWYIIFLQRFKSYLNSNGMQLIY
jgi:hypothetical protein